MMAEGDLGRPELGGGTVEDTATQARAQRAGGFPFRDLLFDDAVGILFDNLVFHAQLLKIRRQNMLREPRLFLIEVHRHQREGDGRAFLQITQDLQHGIAVLAARKTNHNAVALFNHIEVGNRLTDVAAQTFLQLIDVVLFFFTDFLVLQHVIVAQFIVWHQKSTRSASLDNVALARSN